MACAPRLVPPPRGPPTASLMILPLPLSRRLRRKDDCPISRRRPPPAPRPISLFRLSPVTSRSRESTSTHTASDFKASTTSALNALTTAQAANAFSPETTYNDYLRENVFLSDHTKRCLSVTLSPRPPPGASSITFHLISPRRAKLRAQMLNSSGLPLLIFTHRREHTGLSIKASTSIFSHRRWFLSPVLCFFADCSRC